LVWDSAGNLYGTTTQGGPSGSGTAFKVDKKSRFSVLHTFFSSGAGGWGPNGPLVLDAAGNLYDTTPNGGNPGCVSGSGCGVVFKLDPTGNETVLRAFVSGKRGDMPSGGLIRDAADNLYGTNAGGGYRNHGMVFELDAADIETVLYTFMGKADGEVPAAGLIRDFAGNSYGTAAGGILTGGDKGAGVVFKLDPSGNYTTLYTFTGKSDGSAPNGYLAIDAAGNLYGTTFYGGGSGCGVVYRVDLSGHETVLYSFKCGTDGGFPVGGLTIDPAGILYGTAAHGGNPNDCVDAAGCGVVFKITP
jgi:uncharacterized repeat protein (TIGR03803 family)